MCLKGHTKASTRFFSFFCGFVWVLVFLSNLVLIFFWGGVGGQRQGDQEISGIGIHDVKYKKIIKVVLKVYFKGLERWLRV